jgi:hypothetical protein
MSRAGPKQKPIGPTPRAPRCGNPLSWLVVSFAAPYRMQARALSGRLSRFPCVAYRRQPAKAHCGSVLKIYNCEDRSNDCAHRDTLNDAIATRVGHSL